MNQACRLRASPTQTSCTFRLSLGSYHTSAVFFGVKDYIDCRPSLSWTVCIEKCDSEPDSLYTGLYGGHCFCAHSINIGDTKSRKTACHTDSKGPIGSKFETCGGDPEGRHNKTGGIEDLDAAMLTVPALPGSSDACANAGKKVASYILCRLLRTRGTRSYQQGQFLQTGYGIGTMHRAVWISRCRCLFRSRHGLHL